MTINFLYELFERYALPDEIMLDNASQFIAGEFEKFCEDFAIKHITTPTYHPRSNGEVERFGDTFKRALKNQEV